MVNNERQISETYEAAKESGLIDRDFFSKDEVNVEKLKSANTSTLEQILKSDSLSSDARTKIETELSNRINRSDNVVDFSPAGSVRNSDFVDAQRENLQENAALQQSQDRIAIQNSSSSSSTNNNVNNITNSTTIVDNNQSAAISSTTRRLAG